MTSHLLYELSKPIIFAHRGASAYAPENTIASFILAVKQNAPAIELDAKLSKDNQIVVFHDPTTDRTTGFRASINKLSINEIKSLDAGSHFDSSFQGEKVPTLSEVFDAVGRETLINIELTNYVSPFDSLPVLVAELVKKYNLQQSVFFSSFNPIALKRIHALLPEVPIALLAESGKKGWVARSPLMNWLPYHAIHPHFTDVTNKFIEIHHKRAHLINTYTVNHLEEMKRLFHIGIDGIFTDDPLLAQQALASSSAEITN